MFGSGVQPVQPVIMPKKQSAEMLRERGRQGRRGQSRNKARAPGQAPIYDSVALWSSRAQEGFARLSSKHPVDVIIAHGEPPGSPTPPELNREEPGLAVGVREQGTQ